MVGGGQAFEESKAHFLTKSSLARLRNVSSEKRYAILSYDYYRGKDMGSKYTKLSQDKLREKYHCYGHFYNLIVNKKSILCRSVLEIVEAGSNLDNEIKPTNHTPDAITIMMNPGGSEPDLTKISNYIEHQIDDTHFNIDFMKKRLVRAVPDTTQDRIMNIMNVMKWKHVRILNLSDVREKNSTYLNTHIQKFNSALDSSIHSIFSSKRKEEMELAMTKRITPIVIFGWGTHESLETIAEYAFKFITNENNMKYVGIKQEKYNFYHPARRKDWHDDILDQILNL